MQVIKCGTLIDGVSENSSAGKAIKIDNGGIKKIEDVESFDNSETVQEIDFSNKVVLPGLIDAHVHLNGTRTWDPFEQYNTEIVLSAARASTDLRKLICNGFTSVRDMGSSAGLGLKSAVEEGSIKGPRVITSDRQIAQVAGHGDFPFLPYKLVRKDGSFRTTIVSGEEDCREEVRKRVRKGADLIKVMLTPGVAIGSKDRTKYYFSDKELDALIDEAHRYNIPVACHCIGEEGIHRAVQYGVQTIEHGAGLSKEDAEKMKANDIVLVSTLSIFNRFVEEGDKTEIKKENLLEAGRVREKHIDSIRLAYQQEVPIALGTDSIGDNLAPHGENALELELYVNEIGMTEMDAIKAGTTVAAMALNREDIGSIERGKRADLLILNSNPLDDIENIYDVCQVYKDGEPCL